MGRSEDDFSKSEDEALMALWIFGGLISIIGSIFIMFTYLKYRELRKLSFTLIFNVSICDFILSFGNLLGSPKTSNGLCQFQAFLVTFGGLSSLYWVFIIAWVMHSVVFQPEKWQLISEQQLKRRIRYFHIVWPVVLIISILPLTSGGKYTHYRNTGGRCWISHVNSLSQFWSFFCFYIWLWLLFVVLGIIYYRLYKVISKNNNNNNVKNKSMNTINRMKWYPLVLVIAYFFATFRRIWNFSGSDSPFGVVTLRVFFAAIYGFLNGSVYGYTIYKNMKEIGKSKEIGDADTTTDQSEYIQSEIENENNAPKNEAIQPQDSIDVEENDGDDSIR